MMSNVRSAESFLQTLSICDTNIFYLINTHNSRTKHQNSKVKQKKEITYNMKYKTKKTKLRWSETKEEHLD